MITTLSADSARDLTHQTLVAYSYSYPHKSSYRRLIPPVPIAEAWKGEDRGRLFLYIHVPFCEMRCGFCNLFTASQPQADLVDRYLEALARQIEVTQRVLPDAKFSRLALGGGTPTYLTGDQIDRLFQRLHERFDADPIKTPTSVETSPATADDSRLDVLHARGVDRVSIGVQSFRDKDAWRIGRPQRVRDVYLALERIRKRGFRILNIDLIYGDTQSMRSWVATVREALMFKPEELYLYPLYVRPETGLAKVRGAAARRQVDLYRAGRDALLAAGYEQLSLRCFRQRHIAVRAEPAYCCQRDGMIGLGCGARSYTRALHYATRFATTQTGVRAILGDWVAQSDDDLKLATHGIFLSEDEQRRRFIIMSLLQSDGLDFTKYAAKFGVEPQVHMPVLSQLREIGWADCHGSILQLTESGMEYSDLIGPLLYSDQVRENLEAFVRL